MIRHVCIMSLLEPFGFLDEKANLGDLTRFLVIDFHYCNAGDRAA
jgi:hypothetical protein